MEELALSEDVNEQMLFWQLLSSRSGWMAIQSLWRLAQPGVQRAILLATLVEGHGVEHWGIAADGSRQWLTALSRWYLGTRRYGRRHNVKHCVRARTATNP